eukprot:1296223-Rhodomonas_salina.5
MNRNWPSSNGVRVQGLGASSKCRVSHAGGNHDRIWDDLEGSAAPSRIACDLLRVTWWPRDRHSFSPALCKNAQYGSLGGYTPAEIASRVTWTLSEISTDPCILQAHHGAQAWIGPQPAPCKRARATDRREAARKIDSTQHR